MPENQLFMNVLGKKHDGVEDMHHLSIFAILVLVLALKMVYFAPNDIN